MRERVLRVAVMAVHNTKRAFRSPANVIWMLIVPIIFGLTVASFFAGQENGLGTVYVVNEDGTSHAQALVTGLEDSPARVRLLGREEALEGLGSGEYDLVLVIPAGFSESVVDGSPRFELLHGPEYRPGAVESRAKSLAGSMVGGGQIATVGLVQRAPNGQVDNGMFIKVRTTFGIYLVFAFAALFARGGLLHQERRDGTLQRLVAAGVPFGEVVAAHVATLFLVGFLQACIVLLVTGLLGTSWVMAGWGALILTLIGTLFVASGLAVCLSGLTRSATLMQGLSGGIPPLLAMISGAFFPLEVAPAALQKAALINPVYWTLELLTEGYIYQGIQGQMVPLAVLLLIGILGMVIGLQGLRRVEL